MTKVEPTGLEPIGSRRGLEKVSLKQSRVLELHLELVQRDCHHILCSGLTWGPR